MVKTEIELSDEQDRRLAELARSRAVSKQELVREAVEKLLELDPGRPLRPDDPEWQRAMQAVGKFSSGLTDVSERHDDYLAEKDW